MYKSNNEVDYILSIFFSIKHGIIIYFRRKKDHVNFELV